MRGYLTTGRDKAYHHISLQQRQCGYRRLHDSDIDNSYEAKEDAHAMFETFRHPLFQNAVFGESVAVS
jgi:hypothetical protein